MSEAVALFNGNQGQLKSILPSNIPVEKFISAGRTALTQYPDLQKCDKQTLLSAFMEAARDGLLPDGKEAVILPYFDRENKVWQANYTPMIKGVIKRLHEAGIDGITVNVVCEGDGFEFVTGDEERLVHSPRFMGRRGAVVAAYAVFRKNGRVIHREVMTREEIDQARAVSRAANGPAWAKWYPEMAKKVVIRRAAKYLDLSEDVTTVICRDDSFGPGADIGDAGQEPVADDEAEETDPAPHSPASLPKNNPGAVVRAYIARLETAEDLTVAEQVWARADDIREALHGHEKPLEYIEHLTYHVLDVWQRGIASFGKAIQIGKILAAVRLKQPGEEARQEFQRLFNPDQFTDAQEKYLRDEFAVSQGDDRIDDIFPGDLPDDVTMDGAEGNHAQT